MINRTIMKAPAVALLTALTLAACSPPAAQAPAAAPAEKSPYAFDLDITLTPKAAAMMKASGEQITIGAYFEGKPAPAREAEADEMGYILLADEQLTAGSEGGRVSVTGAGVTKEKLAELAEGAPLMARVGVYSARQKSPDNVLACTIDAVNYKPVSEITAGSPHTILCETIPENYERLTRGQ